MKLSDEQIAKALAVASGLVLTCTHADAICPQCVAESYLPLQERIRQLEADVEDMHNHILESGEYDD